MILKPVCVPCERFMRPKKNGYRFTEGMPDNNAQPGKREPDQWRPYKLWVGDLWECLDCGAEIVVGVVAGPVAAHFEHRFDEIRTTHGFDQLLVKDC